MFIQTERTPNPATLKFLPGRPVMPQGSANFPDVSHADGAPLAQALFALPGVTAVYFGADFISVTCAEGTDWSTLKPATLAVIMQHFTDQTPLFTGPQPGETPPETAFADNPDDADIIEQIKELIDSRVRPAVAKDGGDIVYHGFQDGIVYLHMQGACAGCPSSTMTLKNGIETLLKHYVPEVIEVRAL